MGDMRVESVVPEEQLKIDEKLIAAVDSVVTALKDNAGRKVVINVATTAASLTESKKDAGRLRKELAARPGIGPLKVKVLDLGNNKFSITVKRVRPQRKGKPKTAKHGAGNSKASGLPAQDIATLPPAEAIKALGSMGNKQALNILKATVENPGLAAMVDAQLGKMGLTKEQYIALLDEGMK